MPVYGSPATPASRGLCHAAGLDGWARALLGSPDRLRRWAAGGCGGSAIVRRWGLLLVLILTACVQPAPDIPAPPVGDPGMPPPRTPAPPPPAAPPTPLPPPP